ncbi:AGAP009327-PA-like protein [Anopheles sinensis]|uniref:AGAP009327-PA-like protein n=1 Tax=Anopheles sinensis TaxID=74873 RepID=A0A084VM56_ANOSI|nr:AGAP009327-PA-like protein [Anopheles sinensis]
MNVKFASLVLTITVGVVLSCNETFYPDGLCRCMMLDIPVCANNNHTYPNYCVLRCLKKTLAPTLAMVEQGTCEQLYNQTSIYG